MRRNSVPGRFQWYLCVVVRRKEEEVRSEVGSPLQGIRSDELQGITLTIALFQDLGEVSFSLREERMSPNQRRKSILWLSSRPLYLPPARRPPELCTTSEQSNGRRNLCPNAFSIFIIGKELPRRTRATTERSLRP